MADETDAIEVIDVTTELVGERRAEWRDGFESGVKQGTTRVLQSDAMQQIAFELKLARVVNEGMIQVAEQRERLLAHWKAEAQWYREERDRIHAEFCAYAKAVEAKFCR